jgi:hypothetical protein
VHPVAVVPAPARSVTKHDRGKALGHLKRLGHVEKRAATALPLSHAATHAASSAGWTHGRGHASGHGADVPHGPLAGPPGHDRGVGKPGDHGAPGARGGGK